MTTGPASPPIKTIMMIDDEQVDQMMYTRVIKRTGLVEDTVTFTYADDALEYLKRTDRPAIDVILLDINMPRMNGFEFLEAATAELGSAFAKLVVVMLTTSMDPSDEERARQFPVVREFINKPLTEEHLAHIAALIARLD